MKPPLHIRLGDSMIASHTLHWILRVSVWACFVGHGMFGIRQKPEWMAFFEPFGIGPTGASALMPLIGLVDVTLGYLALLRPTRALYMYTAVWGVLTALLRPLVGMSLFETLERAGNVGPSVALLLGSGAAALLARPEVYDLSNPIHYRRMKRVLTLTTCLLLLGHGALAALGKPLLVEHWHALGVIQVDDTGRDFARAIGYGEIGGALLLLVWPTRFLCLLIVGWKCATEALFVLAGAPVWEFIERGGSYGAPLALFVALAYGATRRLPAGRLDPIVPHRRTGWRAADPTAG